MYVLCQLMKEPPKTTWTYRILQRKKFVTDFDIGVVREGKIILMLNVTDMNGLQEAMTQPHVLEWDKKHNCVDVIYTLDKQS